MKTIVTRSLLIYFSIFAMLNAADFNTYLIEITPGAKKRESTQNVSKFYEKLQPSHEQQILASKKQRYEAEQLKKVKEQIKHEIVAIASKKNEEEDLDVITLKKRFFQFSSQIPLQNTPVKPVVTQKLVSLTKIDIPLDCNNTDQK